MSDFFITHVCARVEKLGLGVQYVSGRRRPVGEMNGKSGNLNSCAAQLYPRGCLVPSSELICIFDADQVLTWLPWDALALQHSTCGCIPIM